MMRMDSNLSPEEQLPRVNRTIEQLWQKVIDQQKQIDEINTKKRNEYTDKDLLQIVNNKPPISYTYANEAARTGATGFFTKDLKKFAWQTDNDTFWMLKTTAPTWVAVETDKPHRDWIDFDTDVDPDIATARMWWNNGDNTMNIGMAKTGVVLQVGQEQQMFIKNTSGSQIDNGEVVYCTGATGQRATVGLGKADSASTSHVIAVATHDIPNNETGYVTTFGLVRDFDTSAFNDGDRVFLSESTAGAYTSTVPPKDNYVICVGKIIYSHATQGILFVHIGLDPTERLQFAEMTSPSVSFGSNGLYTTIDASGNINTPGTFAAIGSGYFGNDLQVNGEVSGTTAKFGSDTSYTEIESDGTVVFAGDATVWKDEYPQLLAIPRGGGNTPGTIDLDNTSIQVYAFDGGVTTEELHGKFEVQHDYKEGTNPVPHIHWYPTDNSAGDVTWFGEYWARKGSGYLASGTLQTVQSAGGTAWVERRVNFPELDGSNLEIATQVHVRLYRDPTYSGDTYSSDAAIGTFGWHYQVDTIGSRQITTK